jgi:hypothetical protein
MAAAVDLPEAGDAGTDAEAATVPVFVKPIIIAHRQRPWANQTHIALKWVPPITPLLQEICNPPSRLFKLLFRSIEPTTEAGGFVQKMI